MHSTPLTKSTVARVTAEHKEAYKVKNANGEFLAKITGKHMFNAAIRADFPAVGDWVVITELGNKRATIHQILPRKTLLKKPYADERDQQLIAANIDVAFIIESVDRDYNLNRLERYLVLVNQGGITPVIVLNKTDLISETELAQKVGQVKKRFTEIPVVGVNTVTQHGADDLKNLITRGKTYCFLGSSGVGKSSLINALLSAEDIKTREISSSTGKGKHTTTTREMYFLDNGGIVIDNPGIRGIGVGDTGSGIGDVFDELKLLAEDCRFSDCTHILEPGCAVLQAVKNGKLDKARYENYIKLKKENEYYTMTEVERRAKNKKFGQFVKKVKDQLDIY